MNVIIPIRSVFEPRKLLRVATRFFPAILPILDVWGHSQNSCLGGAIQTCLRNPRANVDAHTVIQIGVPTEGLLLNGFPADEHVVRFLPIENLLELALQMLGSGKAAVGTFHAASQVLTLSTDPVSKVGIDQFFERLVIK